VIEFAQLNVFVKLLRRSEFKNQLNILINDPRLKLSVQIGSNLSSNEKETLRIQLRSVAESGRKHYGFEELLAVLDGINPTTTVKIQLIESSDWGGRLVLNAKDECVLGVVLVKRPDGPRLVTPPDWDGSQEMLKRFNDLLKK
jgi:hypothetical protein